MDPCSPGRFLSDDQAIKRLLEHASVRATAQRVGLARLLFGGEHRHISASELHLEAAQQGITISLATVYNTLSQFVQANLLREVSVGSERTYFDTNVDVHGHVYDETTGALRDVPLPTLPLPDDIEPEKLKGVELMFRIRS